MPAPTSTSTTSSDSRSKVIAAAIIVVALIVMGYFLFQSRIFDGVMGGGPASNTKEQSKDRSAPGTSTTTTNPGDATTTTEPDTSGRAIQRSGTTMPAR